MTKRIYMDHAATTPVHPDVVKAMLPYFSRSFGNPSSIHSLGNQARLAIEEARGKVASLIGAQNDEIVFTSGGTESDNSAVKGIAYASQEKGNHIITTAIEHPAVLESCSFLQKEGFEVTYLPVDSFGMVDPQDVRNAITYRTILITMMHANNEVGTIEPIAEICEIARDKGICFHTDAVQTTGHVPVDVNELGVDLLSISAHKLYGPKGTGALFIRKGTSITPLLHGGAQEHGDRASTENVPAIVGFGEAASIAQRELAIEAKQLVMLRDKLISGLMSNIDGIQLNGHPTQRLPNNVNVSIRFAEGEALIRGLDREGICASTGSACSSGSHGPSHVLLALGIPCESNYGSIRFSLGRSTTVKEIDRLLQVLPQIVNRLNFA